MEVSLFLSAKCTSRFILMRALARSRHRMDTHTRPNIHALRQFRRDSRTREATCTGCHAHIHIHARVQTNREKSWCIWKIPVLSKAYLLDCSIFSGRRLDPVQRMIKVKPGINVSGHEGSARPPLLSSDDVMQALAAARVVEGKGWTRSH